MRSAVVEDAACSRMLPPVALPMVVVPAPELLIFTVPSSVVVDAELPMLVAVVLAPVFTFTAPRILVVDAELPIATVPVLVPVLMLVLALTEALRLIAPEPDWSVSALVPIVEPIVTFVVDPAVALVPMLMVWVLLLPATDPIEIVLVAVELPTVMPPVLLLVPMV